MNRSTGIFLGISIVAFIAALVAGYLVFFHGSGPFSNSPQREARQAQQAQEGRGVGEFTSVEAAPTRPTASGKPDADAAKSKEPTSSASRSSTRASTQASTRAAETAKPSERPEPRDTAPAGLPAALADAGLIPARAVCDGTPVLIIESVLDDGTGAQAAERLPDVLDAHPNAVFYSPGACPSLRGTFEGQDVYPVVEVFDSESALCDAWARQGGNPRLLNGDTSYSSPC